MTRPRKIILCVDDNEQILSVRCFLVETWGYRAIGVTSAEEALNLFRQDGPKVDLLLTDLVMPWMDGNELVRRVKEIAPETRAIIVSGAIKAYPRANRADAFLPKGYIPEEMRRIVKILVSRKRGPKKGTEYVPRQIEPATL